jgi:hypothetical protein
VIEGKICQFGKLYCNIIKNMIATRDSVEPLKPLEHINIDFKFGSETKRFTYSNKESLVSDIEFIIFLFAERGSTNKKYISKSLEGVQTIMGWLIEKYGINVVVNAPLTALQPDVVTIPRIVACFPAKICEFNSMFLVDQLEMHIPNFQFFNNVLVNQFKLHISKFLTEF